MRPTKTTHAGGRGSGAVADLRRLYGTGEATGPGGRSQSLRAPANWRDRLPDPATYYGARVDKLGKRSGAWTMGLCPFHDDHNPSFGVKLASESGRWECFAGCGSGDIVAFHMKVTDYGFNQAVRDLLGMRP